MRVPQTLSWYRTGGDSPVPAQAHRGFPSGPMMTSLIRAGGRSSLYLGVPLSTQRSRRSTFSVDHGVSHGIEPVRTAARIASAFALTSSNGPEVEEVKHRRLVPLSKERFDVALEGRRAVVRTLTAFFFQLPSCGLPGQRLLKTAWPGPYCCRLTSPSWTSWLRITTGPSAWVTASAAATPPERQAWSIRLVAA